MAQSQQFGINDVVYYRAGRGWTVGRIVSQHGDKFAVENEFSGNVQNKTANSLFFDTYLGEDALAKIAEKREKLANPPVKKAKKQKSAESRTKKGAKKIRTIQEGCRILNSNLAGVVRIATDTEVCVEDSAGNLHVLKITAIENWI